MPASRPPALSSVRPGRHEGLLQQGKEPEAIRLEKQCVIGRQRYLQAEQAALRQAPRRHLFAALDNVDLARVQHHEGAHTTADELAEQLGRDGLPTDPVDKPPGAIGEVGRYGPEEPAGRCCTQPFRDSAGGTEWPVGQRH